MLYNDDTTANILSLIQENAYTERNGRTASVPPPEIEGLSRNERAVNLDNIIGNMALILHV